MKSSLVLPFPLTNGSATPGAVQMKLEKRGVSEHWLPADVYGKHRLDFPRQRDALATTPRRIVTSMRAGAMAPSTANIDVAFPALEIALISNQGNCVREPAKKLNVVAIADDTLGFVVNVIDCEDNALLS